MDKPRKISAWSFNRLMDFETCPYRSYLDIIERSPGPELPDNHPMLRGSEIHELIDQYIKGEGKPDKVFKSLQETIDFCREHYAEGTARSEERWAFDNTWGVLDDWMHDQVWVRIVADCLVHLDERTALIYDWKTGKSWGNEVKHTQQGQLYAIAAFYKFPMLDTIDVAMGYVDEGKCKPKTYQRDAKFFRLASRWHDRGLRMTEATTFPPKPNAMNCRYCKFGPSGTGACIYGVEPL